jgi:hypothetical protein
MEPIESTLFWLKHKASSGNLTTNSWKDASSPIMDNTYPRHIPTKRRKVLSQCHVVSHTCNEIVKPIELIKVALNQTSSCKEIELLIVGMMSVVK